MSVNAAKYGILVGVDGSAESDAAIRWAADEAVMRGLPVTLMHVVTPILVSWPLGPALANITEWQEDNARRVIAHAQKTLDASVSDTELPEARGEVRYAGSVGDLVDATKDAWMVVVGNSDLGAVGRAVLGSVSGGLVHHAHCPVTVVHETDTDLSSGLRRYCWASTARPPLRRPPPWLSTRPPAGVSISLRCMRGAMSVCFRSSAWIGASMRTAATRSWRNASLAGRSVFPTCMSGDDSCAISRPAG